MCQGHEFKGTIMSNLIDRLLVKNWGVKTIPHSSNRLCISPSGTKLPDLSQINPNRFFPKFYLMSCMASLMLVACSGEGTVIVDDVRESKTFKYEPTIKSLETAPIPNWFHDAKFGIMIHWGPYSVIGELEGGLPADYAEHAASNIYRPELGDYQTPWKEGFGALPPKFGYKDTLPLFTGEKFDAERWVDMFEGAGAKYVVPVAEHHDGFAMWDSDLTTWDAKERGPKIDIIGELAVQVKKRGLKFAPSIHRERHTTYYAEKKNVGGSPLPTIVQEIKAMPEAASLYGPFELNDAFMEDFLARWEEIEDKYQPDFFWLDNFPGTYSDRDKKFFAKHIRVLIANYLNKAGNEWGKEVYFNNKGGYLIHPPHVGVREKDNLELDDLSVKWQNPATLGVSFGYQSMEETDPRWTKPTRELIHLLIETVSHNGNLLLNVGPRSDGTIAPLHVSRLAEIGSWLKANGEAVYGTRVWTTAGEGRVRFTTKGDVLYAHLLDWPEENHLTIESVSSWNDEDIAGVYTMAGEALDWSLTSAGLKVKLPATPITDHTTVLKIQATSPLRELRSISVALDKEDLHKIHIERVRSITQ